MKKITTSNYKADKLYPRVVRAMSEILKNGDVVAPVEVMIHMQCIDRARYEDWRFERIPYLERVFVGSLGKANRILRIVRMHAHDLNLVPSPTVYHKWGRGGKRILLRFSKSGEPALESAYARHFVRAGKPRNDCSVASGAPERACV
jgi:hypothetical protein